ncbi:hypothetical protein [Petrachloros mirabilis]
MRNTFARTLDEAFGLDATSACAVTCYRSRGHKLMSASVWICAIAAVALLVLIGTGVMR